MVWVEAGRVRRGLGVGSREIMAGPADADADAEQMPHTQRDVVDLDMFMPFIVLGASAVSAVSVFEACRLAVALPFPPP